MTLTALRLEALIATAFLASMYAVFFNWRGRLVRRLRTDHDGGASAIAHTKEMT